MKKKTEKFFNLCEIRKLKGKDYYRLRQYLELQKPEDLSKIAICDMQQRYCGKTRKNILAVDILVYWEIKFSLDWGEPECFGCKQFGWSGLSGVEEMSAWDHYFEKAHIVSAYVGGPSEAWNVVYLCSWCHKTFDNTFLGFPWEYRNQVEWLMNRREWVVQSLMDEIKAIIPGVVLLMDKICEDMRLFKSFERKRCSKKAFAYASRKIKELSTPYEIVSLSRYAFRMDYAIKELRRLKELKGIQHVKTHKKARQQGFFP